MELNDQCNTNLYGYNSFGYNITEQMLCAGEDGKGFCEGDSGSPLIFKPGRRGSYVLIGVASRVISPEFCGDREFPGIYFK